MVRAADHLQAAVLFGGRIHRDRGAAEEREQNAVLIPIAVVLVPGPGAAGPGVLHDHLGMVVVDLARQQLFGRLHNPPAARGHAVDRVSGMVPEGQPDSAALAIGTAERMPVKRAVLPRGPAQQLDFIRLKHPLRQDVAVFAISANLIVRDGACGHYKSESMNFVISGFVQSTASAIFRSTLPWLSIM